MKTINNDDEKDSGRLQRIRIIPIIATCRVTDIKDHQEQRIKVKRNKRKVKKYLAESKLKGFLNLCHFWRSLKDDVSNRLVIPFGRGDHVRGTLGS